MKIIGIIAEYNPFHLGHHYQIKKIKELYPNSLIIAIISTNFTQRGDISIINKWDKTKICLEYGIDLIVELPTIYATQSADIFAKGALQILNELKIDTLVFGSESNDVKSLIKLAKIQLNDKTYQSKVKEYLDTGINYPSAMSKALKDITTIKIDKPNDLLGLSYIKEIIKQNYQITPIAIQRTNDYHSKSIDAPIINATLIRELYLAKKDITPYIPPKVNTHLYPTASINNAYNYLLLRIITNNECLSNYLTVDEGIEKRILANINKSETWQELTEHIKTKRYTYNKINRMLIHILLGIKKEDNNNSNYLRILGFNSQGQAHLNKIKKHLNLELYTNYKPNRNSALDLEYKSTYVYSLIINDKTLAEKEFQNKPIIYKKDK